MQLLIEGLKKFLNKNIVKPQLQQSLAVLDKTLGNSSSCMLCTLKPLRGTTSKRLTETDRDRGTQRQRRWTNGRMDRLMVDRRTDGQTDRRTYRQIDRSLLNRKPQNHRWQAWHPLFPTSLGWPFKQRLGTMLLKDAKLL